MFRIVCDPSSGSIELYLTEIIGSGSQMFVVINKYIYIYRGCGGRRWCIWLWFDSRLCHWNFLLTFLPHYGPGVDSASNRNEYQGCLLVSKCGRCVRLTTLPHLCSDFYEIWEPQPPGTLRACRLLYLHKYRMSNKDVYTLLGRILTSLSIVTPPSPPMVCQLHG